MTTYTAIPDSDIDANSPVTATLMTLMRDNPIAITEKAAGAPVLGNGYIVEAMYGASSVDQTAIKTATSAQSRGASGSLSLSGGSYGMITSLSGSVVSGKTAWGAGGGDLGAGTMYWNGDAGGYGVNSTGYIDTRYFQASPPYGTADGPIPLFIYVEIELVTGRVLSVSVAPDPIWAYHGPTDIRGHLSVPDTIDRNGKIVRLGKMVRDVPEIIAELGELEYKKQFKNALLGNRRQALNRLRRRKRDDRMVEVEITQDYKNSDMNIAPHPWYQSAARVAAAETTGPKGGVIPEKFGSEVILLDPQNTLDLLELHNDGENILKLVEDGTIKIRNSELNRIVPAGMKAYGFRF